MDETLVNWKRKAYTRTVVNDMSSFHVSLESNRRESAASEWHGGQVKRDPFWSRGWRGSCGDGVGGRSVGVARARWAAAATDSRWAAGSGSANGIVSGSGSASGTASGNARDRLSTRSQGCPARRCRRRRTATATRTRIQVARGRSADVRRRVVLLDAVEEGVLAVVAAEHENARVHDAHRYMRAVHVARITNPKLEALETNVGIA